MDDLKQKYETFTKALATLDKSVKKIEQKTYTDYEETRDSLIQRFEYSSDLFWKLLKVFVTYKTGSMPAISCPKTVYQDSFNLGIITKNELDGLYEMVEDRNITSHTYDEEFANDLCKRIPKHAALIKNILSRISI